MVRAGLRDAHTQSLRHINSTGPSLSADVRRRIAEVARDAYLSSDPTPPWVTPFDEPELNFAYRLARHAATITRDWVESIGLEPLVALEVVGVVISIVPVTAFARAVGSIQPAFPVATEDSAKEPSATRESTTAAFAENLCAPTLNWFPVAAPFRGSAAVVQALSALPTEFANLWQLAEAQYMSEAQMDDPAWSRGELSRAQSELVASRISKLRECFY